MDIINIKPLVDDFLFPERASDGSAAYDALIQQNYCIRPGRQIVPLGFALSMPKKLMLDNRTRSGYAAFGMKVYDELGNEYRLDADCILGLIDSDYRNELGCIINVRQSVWNFKVWWKLVTGQLFFKRGQAISQLSFQNVPETLLFQVESLDETSRIGGFGKQNGEYIMDDKH